jgi:uncharacterized protein (DUF488 family)
MTDGDIFTIGHSDHRIERFLVLLARHRVDAVADVRSLPRSRFNPQFDRDALTTSLKAAGMRYVFLGEELGARRSEPDCYVDGKARYELIARLPRFHDGLKRLQEGAIRFRIAIMCAEKDPLTCHRSILVCRRLRNLLSIRHILADGDVEQQEQFERRLMKVVGVNGSDLISTHCEAVEHAYDLQGERIAYSTNAQSTEEGV